MSNTVMMANRVRRMNLCMRSHPAAKLAAIAARPQQGQCFATCICICKRWLGALPRITNSCSHVFHLQPTAAVSMQHESLRSDSAELGQCVSLGVNSHSRSFRLVWVTGV